MRRTRQSNPDTLGVWISVISFVLVLLLVVLPGYLTPESRARHAAGDAGYTHVTVVDKATILVGFRGCDNSDGARFTVRGVNPLGEERTFYVCAGPIKGGTVRSE